jgi:hypothetical protein
MSLVRASSAWELSRIEAFFVESVIPVRLAVVNESGRPLVCSLWFLYADGALWCATKASASVAKYLEQQPACGFEVAPESMPYRGVRGQGCATVLPDEGLPVLLRLIDRYLGARDSEFAQWLAAQASDEVAIRIEPDWITAWDFSGRMKR